MSLITFLFIVSIEMIGIILEIFFLFVVFRPKKVPVKRKPVELHKDNYPFDEGEPLDWYNLNS